MTRMAPSLTALLLGMWTLVSAAQLVQTTSQLKLRPSCRAAYTELNTWLHLPPLQFVHLLQILKMHQGCCKRAWPNRSKGDFGLFGAMNFVLTKTDPLDEQKPLSDDDSNSVVRQGSEHCAEVKT